MFNEILTGLRSVVFRFRKTAAIYFTPPTIPSYKDLKELKCLAAQIIGTCGAVKNRHDLMAGLANRE